MVKPVSNGKTTDNKGTSRVLLRLYTVSLRFKYASPDDPWWQHQGQSGLITVHHNAFVE